MGVECLDMVFKVERAFGVMLNDAAMERIVTVGDLADFVSSQLEKQGRLPRAGRLRIERQVRCLAVQVFVWPLSAIGPGTTFQELHSDWVRPKYR